MVSKKSTKKSKSGRNKSTTRVQVHQPDQVDAVPAAPSDDINPAPAVGTKNVWELKIDELRKECVKLGLLDTNTKDKKERCLTLLTEYLSKRGISMGTFKFASNGETVYADVLLGAPVNGTPITTDESDSESSDSETESDEEARKKQSKAARRLARNTRFNSVSFSDVSSSASATSNKSPNMLPPGWQVLPNQVTGEPVALLDPAGKVHAVGTSAMVNNSPQRVTSTADDTSRSISTAAALLRGMGETETASMSTARTVNPAPANNFNSENLDFCGVSVPGSLYTMERENSAKKIVSGKYSTGKKNTKKSDNIEKDNTDSGDKVVKNKNKKCTKEWVISQNICFNYQNDQCDQGSGHDDGAGKMMVHCCAWCQFNNKGLQIHSNTTCTEKSNPFRRSHSQRGQ